MRCYFQTQSSCFSPNRTHKNSYQLLSVGRPMLLASYLLLDTLKKHANVQTREVDGLQAIKSLKKNDRYSLYIRWNKGIVALHD